MISASDINDYSDLKSLTIDQSKPLEKRLMKYIVDVKNPYMVRIGDMLVQIEFAGKRSFSDSLSAALII